MPLSRKVGAWPKGGSDGVRETLFTNQLLLTWWSGLLKRGEGGPQSREFQNRGDGFMDTAQARVLELLDYSTACWAGEEPVRGRQGGFVSPPQHILHKRHIASNFVKGCWHERMRKSKAQYQTPKWEREGSQGAASLTSCLSPAIVGQTRSLRLDHTQAGSSRIMVDPETLSRQSYPKLILKF